MAFQLQDDYLDTFGDPETFGKQIGGDIIENKKTFLYLKSLEVSNAVNKEKLESFYNQKLEDNSFKIKEVTNIFESSNIPVLIKEQIANYTEKAFETLTQMDIPKTDKDNLKTFGLWLMNRTV